MHVKYYIILKMHIFALKLKYQILYRNTDNAVTY